MRSQGFRAFLQAALPLLAGSSGNGGIGGGVNGDACGAGNGSSGGSGSGAETTFRRDAGKTLTLLRLFSIFDLPSVELSQIDPCNRQMARLLYTSVTKTKPAVPMAGISIELDWTRDPKGYRLVEKAQPPKLRIVRNGTEHPSKLPPFQPLASTDLLFKVFANTATTPEGALDFVQRFGPLTKGGWGSEGEDVNSVMYQAEKMWGVLTAWFGRQKPPVNPIVVRSPIASRLPLVVNRYDTGPSIALDAKVVCDPLTKALKWELHPNSLLDALWLQLGQKLTAGAEIRQCEHCGDWFEAGQGTGRRLDAKFCSDEHRVLYNSLKRSRGK